MDTTTSKPRLTGQSAIEYAEQYGLLLCKYEDPTESARAGLTPDEAREIAHEDPSLVYVDVEVRVIRLAACYYEPRRTIGRHTQATLTRGERVPQGFPVGPSSKVLPGVVPLPSGTAFLALNFH